MVQTLHPGVYTIELDAQPKVTGVGITTGGFVGIAQKGPDDRAILVTSYSQFESIYGGFFKFDEAGTEIQTYLAYAVDGFFKSGGSACYVLRALSTGAVAAGATILETDGVGTAITAASLYKGKKYNDYFLDFRKASTVTAEAIDDNQGATANNTVEFVDATGFERGDAVRFGDSTGTFLNTDGVEGRVQYIKRISGNDVTFCKQFTATGTTVPVAAGASVHTCSRHRKTIIGFLDSNEVLTSTSSTSIRVVAGLANNIVKGQHLLIAGTDDGLAIDATGSNSAECDVIVTGVVRTTEADTIMFAAPTFRGDATTIIGTANSAEPPIIVSMETTLNIFDDGDLVETHPFLAFNSTNTRDYIGDATTPGRLIGTDSNQSNLISAPIAGSITGGQLGEYPFTTGPQAMASGIDGTAFPLPGVQFTASHLALFDSAPDMTMLSAPDIVANTITGDLAHTDAVITAAQTVMQSHVATRTDIMLILDTPFDSSTTHKSMVPQDVLDYRLNLPFDSSRVTLYWPHLVIPDPAVTTEALSSPTAFSQGFGSSVLRIPPCGHVMGQYAKIAASKGPHVAAANIPHNGVFDVTYHVTDAEQDTLNPKGINCIRKFPGQGIRTWGARTLWSVTDGRHYAPVVRLLQFIERSVREGNRFAVFQPNDPALWTQITAANESFLSGIWQQGMLFPSDNEDQAYFVKCDASTNPPSERAAGRVNCLIGVNPPKPAEFVVFKIGLFEGTSEIEAIITGANAAGFLVG